MPSIAFIIIIATFILLMAIILMHAVIIRFTNNTSYLVSLVSVFVVFFVLITVYFLAPSDIEITNTKEVNASVTSQGNMLIFTTEDSDKILFENSNTLSISIPSDKLVKLEKQTYNQYINIGNWHIPLFYNINKYIIKLE